MNSLPFINCGIEELQHTHIDLKNSVATDNYEEVVLAYLKEEDFSIKDTHGNNLLHIAAKEGLRTMCRGICALTGDLELWNQKNKEGLTPIDVADPKTRRDLLLISMRSQTVPSHHSLANRELLEARLQQSNPNFKVLLSLDGGGVRAILEATMLMAIEKELGEPILSRTHWLGGTSCGGIMAMCLGCGISPDEQRRVFFYTRKKTFCGNTKMFPKHDSAGLEQNLKDIIGSYTTMSCLATHKVMVTAAKCQSAPPSLILFRTYAPRVSVKEFEQYGYFDPDKILAWKAMRCTSAAPVYFSSFHGLADGAIFCNNPCTTLMTDFFKLKKVERFKGVRNDDEIGCVISIGSGSEPVVPLGGIDINLSNALAIGRDFREIFGNGKNLITLFMYQCTSSHAVPVGQAREWAHSLNIPFFRFSPRLSRAFELDSHQIDGIFDFMFETEVYLRTQARQDIADLVKLLKTMPKNESPNYKDIVHHNK
ncbi:unnamed protein product [Caenorhabditis auriculariae]|uniref:PNPLA domain-containing protein n=1 Tax=Caenorhabditis auriculariae TaxID=2777116 RepID=A0A8S1H7F2_9PELO|nr:unnamed protein product [Caenorhabditis auriculariae]